MGSPFAEILRLLPLLGAGGQGYVQGRQIGQQYRAGEQDMSQRRAREVREETLFEEQLADQDYQRNTVRPMEENRLRQSTEDMLPEEAALLGEEMGVPPTEGYNREQGLRMLGGQRKARLDREQRTKAAAMRRKMYESQAQLQAIFKDLDWRNYLVNQVNKQMQAVQQDILRGDVDPDEGANELRMLNQELTFLIGQAAPARERVEGVANKQAGAQGVQPSGPQGGGITIVAPAPKH